MKGKLEVDGLLRYRGVCSQPLCHTLCHYILSPQHDDLWSQSPGTLFLPDLLQILKTELCPSVPLPSDSTARSWTKSLRCHCTESHIHFRVEASLRVFLGYFLV